jgi:hypothetical protein
LFVGEIISEPEINLLSLQPPEAVQLVASVEDQERVADCPEMIDVGDTEKERVGAGFVGVGVKLDSLSR